MDMKGVQYNSSYGCVSDTCVCSINLKLSAYVERQRPDVLRRTNGGLGTSPL